MSLYLGNSINSNKILHITDSFVPENSIKVDYALPSTIFHSSLPYLQLVASYTIPVTRSITFTTSGLADYCFTGLFSNEAIDLILAGYSYVIVLSSINSNNREVIVDTASRFYVRTGVSPSINFGTNAPYSWGPTVNSSSWESNPSSTPSYTNKYILLSDKLNYDNPFLYPHNYGQHSLDTVNNSIASVYFFNIKNNSLEILNSTNKINIDHNTFIIGTPNVDINLANFKPMRYLDTPSSTSFSTLNSLLNIQPYILPNSTVNSWIIDGSGTSDGKIIKVLASGEQEEIISNRSKNLVLLSSTSATYTVTVNNGSSTASLNTSIATDEAVSILAYGIFSSPITTKNTGGHASFLTPNNILETVAYGRTEYIKNGVTYGDLYRLQFGVITGDLKVRITNQKISAATSNYSGTFSGTVYILKFKIK